MEENQIRENIEDYRFSFKKLFLVFKDIFGGEKNAEDDKILEEVAKIKAQESPRIKELCDKLDNHETIVKKSRRGTTKSRNLKFLYFLLDKRPNYHYNIICQLKMAK